MSKEFTDIDSKKRQEAAVDLPQRGVISTVTPEMESVTTDLAHYSGAPQMVIRHPYFGVNSWIRVMPEPGTAVLTQNRGDQRKQEIWGYISNNVPRLLRAAKTGKQILFRQLNQGDIEIQSKGRAYTHWGTSGELVQRGGMIEQCLSQKDLELSSIAPTHKRRLALHSASTVAHEERFGVVKRPDPDNPNSGQKYVKTSSGAFAHEYSRFLNAPPGEDVSEEGRVLSSTQEGHVIDLNAKIKKSDGPNRDLRYERMLQGHLVGPKMKHQVDVDLNMALLIRNAARVANEVYVSVGDYSRTKVETDKITINGNTNGRLVFGRGMYVQAPELQIVGHVTFGRFGGEPVLLGQSFINGFLKPFMDMFLTLLTTMSWEMKAPTPAKPVTGVTIDSLTPLLDELVDLLPTFLSTEVSLSS